MRAKDGAALERGWGMQKRIVFGLAMVAAVALVALIWRVCREPGPARYPFRDREDRIVFYHGVNISNAAKSAPGFLSWHTKDDYARLHRWGFNCVRYLVFWEAIEPREGVYDEAYIDATMERIRWMGELGIDVILDFHQDLYARKFTGNGFPGWTVRDDGIPFHARSPWNYNYFEKAVIRSYANFWASQALRAKYIAMLEHVVRRIDALPNIAGVDIMNEPFGGFGLGFEPRTLSSFYEEVQAMWQRNGFAARLCFEPMIYNSGGLPTRLTFKPGANCVFAPHYYDPFCHEGVGYGRFAKRWMRLWVRERVKDGQRFRTPVLYGEFGIASTTPGYLDYLGDFLSLLDKYQVSWTYYSYDKTSAESFGVLDDGGNPKENMNVLIRLYPQRVAGDNPVFQTEARCFDLSYTANGSAAPTVVFVPPRLAGVTATFNGHAVPYDAQTNLVSVQNEGGQGARQKLHITWQ
jgi:endoglycosylceramidase